MQNEEMELDGRPVAEAPESSPYRVSQEEVAQVVEALKTEDAAFIHALLDEYHAADQADLIEQLSSKNRRRLIDIARDQIEPEALTELEETVRDEILDLLGPREVAAAMSELEADDAAYLIQDLDDADRREVLDAMPVEERADVEAALSYPLVLKIPDGSFSRGVVKVENRSDLLEHGKRLFRHSAVILAQEFMYTEYDWRVGVLNRKPLFVSQYFMSRRHWQIINHKPGGGFAEGAFRAVAVEDAPKEVVEAGVRAANLVGDGLYGVDLKQRENGVFVIEINDNPNIDRGVEDGILKDDLYKTVLRDLVRRIESR